MAIRTRPPRSVSDIKTHSGRAKSKLEVYRNFFQVGALELERWRREREREAAEARINGIDNRIAEIERDKQRLLDNAERVRPSAPARGPADPRGPRSPGGRRFKY